MHFRQFPTIQENNNSPDVTIARRAINRWLTDNNAGDAKLSNDRSDFNSTTTCYTKAFQARHNDPGGSSLAVDGIIGANTWFALADYSNDIDNAITTESIVDRGQAPEIISLPPPSLEGTSTTAIKALEFAMQEIGVKENPPSSNRGAKVERYQSEGPNDNPAPGLPWCASFVSWCYYHAVEKNIAKMPFHYTASSRNIEKALSSDNKFHLIKTATDLAEVIPGDILIWFRCGDLNPMHGHVGFVHHYNSGTHQLYTIEGNRDHRVWAGQYSWDKNNSKRLIQGLIGYGRV